MYGGLGELMGSPGSQMVNLHTHGMDEVGWEKRWVSLAILGWEDGSLPTLKVDKENRMWTEFGLFWPWRWGRKSKICNGFSFPTLLTNISLVFKFKIEHIFALTGGARPFKRVLVQRSQHFYRILFPWKYWLRFDGHWYQLTHKPFDRRTLKKLKDF